METFLGISLASGEVTKEVGKNQENVKRYSLAPTSEGLGCCQMKKFGDQSA